MGNVYISPNLKRVSERIDPQGNIINPRTKEIIRANNDNTANETVVEPAQNMPSNAPQASTLNAMSIQEQIDEAKRNIAKLEELKKAKIAEMKAQLALLEE